jgi:hypothetical protein
MLFVVQRLEQVLYFGLIAATHVRMQKHRGIEVLLQQSFDFTLTPFRRVVALFDRFNVETFLNRVERLLNPALIAFALAPQSRKRSIVLDALAINVLRVPAHFAKGTVARPRWIPRAVTLGPASSRTSRH